MYKFYTGRFRGDSGDGLDGCSVHVVDFRTEELYTYVQELKSWNHNLMIEDHFYFPELHSGDSGQVVFEELSYGDVPAKMSLVKKFNRSDETQRRLSNQARAQVTKSGKAVLTSAEVGILTKDLGQRPAAAPMIKELIESRSRYRQWTALWLYSEEGPTPREAVRTLSTNARLKTNSKGQHIAAQQRWRSFTIEGEARRLLTVEVKYVRAADEGLGDGPEIF